MMLINLPLSTAHSPADVLSAAAGYGLRVDRYRMSPEGVFIAEIRGGTMRAQRGIMALAEYFQSHLYAVDVTRPDDAPSYHPARGADPGWRMQRVPHPVSGGNES